MVVTVVQLLGARAARVAALAILIATRALLIVAHFLRFMVGVIVISAIAWLTALSAMLPAVYFVSIAVGIYALWAITQLVRELKQQEDDLPWALPLASRQKVPASVKQVVYYRDKGRCQYCARRYGLEYRPVIPLSKGGSKTISNIRLLCQACA